MIDLHAAQPLHPDLESHIQQGTMSGMMVHHPLVITPLYSKTHCSLINTQYLQKLEMVKEAANQLDFYRMVMLYERPYRYEALQIAIALGLEDHPEKYWEVVRQVWTDSENIHENMDAWRALWKADAPKRHLVMTQSDRAAFSRLPKKVRVYRGHDFSYGRLGLSWTTDRKKAIWFAHRTNRIPYLSMAMAPKDKIYAYFNGRDEKEIVIDTDNLSNIEYSDM